MALQVQQFAATIPTGTSRDAPVTVPLDIDNWVLEQLDLEVPAGPSGLMGFAVFNNGVQWIPSSPGTWLVWDDVQQSWPFTDQPDASGWQVVGYNMGIYDHTVTVRFHVNPPPTPSAAGGTPTVRFVTSPPPSATVTVL